MQKVKVLKRAYYNNMLLKPNDIILFEGEVLPSWAEVLENKNEIKKSKKQPNRKTKKMPELSTENLSQKLDRLKTIALDRGVMLDVEDKSISEQIKEFEKILKAEG